ncbi:glycosyltransferase family 4 protein [Arthrobacter sp. C9C5]|uniref:glycosyltransferase family 4 protein n=1 Tax=Arthrobacter sp. C9C5 TaxID=2735267 RepID=UPI001585C32F|nr:glycosyltransferase family 4 protein [Arthrobacter sp. C9C5]NUU31080.1 glycosyltransferase family 4 protein [Arthrobacter sp. C9C5]
MKILVVTTWFPSPGSPAQAPFNLEHAKAIQILHDVRVVHVRLGSSLPTAMESYDGLPVQRISLDPRRPWTALSMLRLLLKESSTADVLHTMAFSSALVAVLPALLRRVPWVHSEHWSGVTNPRNVAGLWPRFAWLRWVLRLPHAVTGVTAELVEKLQTFARPEAAVLVPCVVANERPLMPPPADERLRLVAVGGLVPGKRPLLAIRTIAALKESGQDVHLSWVGDGPLRREAEELIAELKLGGNVTLVGTVPPTEVFAFFEEAHLFFLPTAHENFFTSAAEALSAGRAVVVPRVGGFTDYVTAANGVLVDDDSPESLAAAIVAARRTFAGADPAAIAAPIRDRFSRNTVGRLFEDVYGRVLAATATGGGRQRG